MKKYFPYIYAILILLCSTYPSFAMDGIGTYFRANVTGKLYKGLSFFIEEDIRPQEDFKELQWIFSTAEVNYRFNKYLKAGVGYMCMVRYKDADQLRNRYYLYATGRYPVGHFTFSVRERFQSTFRAHANHPSNYLRSMFNVSYKIGKSNFSPFYYVEFFNDTRNHLKADKIRFSTGMDYKLNTKNSLQLFYRYHIFNVNDPVNYKNVFGVCYSHHF